MLTLVAEALHGLFRGNGGSRSLRNVDTAVRLEQKVLKLVGNMPTLPDVAARAMALSDDPNATVVDFGRLIEGDGAIATDLLRVANSALYRGCSPVVTPSQAVIRMGMFPCKSLVVSISMKSLMRNMAEAQTQQCEELWHHGFVTGCLCLQINRSFQLKFNGEEFSAGLLHDLGRILLLLADAECFAQVDGLDFVEEPELLDRERDAIGIDHCSLGGWFGKHNKLPDVLIHAMKHHHDRGVLADDKRLVTLVATADHMANHLQRGEDVDSYRPEENAGLASLWAAWPDEKRQQFVEEIPALMVGSVEAAATLQTGR
jgi:HD-like signal output (HDOD) protein